MKWLVMIGLLGAGCLHPNTEDCGGGIECPVGLVCTMGGGCATPGDVAACDGLAGGAACRTITGSVGICERGACRSGLCGNGVIDSGETCDRELGVNTAAGETCSADCTRIEVCGNAVVDPGEQCDDGNANPADGCDACVRTTWRATVAIGGASLSATSVAMIPFGVAVDLAGNLYIADAFGHRVERVDPAGVITTVAGNGTAGFSGDGGAATSARLDDPVAVALDGLGNLYVADQVGARVRRVDLTGVITTVAGTGTAGYTGDGGAATGAQLNEPTGIALDGLGDLYIADELNNAVRRVDTTGIITTVAGTGPANGGYNNDNIAATTAKLHFPTGVVVDGLGNLYIADRYNHRIRRVSAAGLITTVAGTGVRGFGGDGDLATKAMLTYPNAITLDGNGNVIIDDHDNNRIRRVSSAGIITTIAGSNLSGYAGDGGPATAAALSDPNGVAVDSIGNLYIADASNDRVRRVNPTGLIATIAGTGVSVYSGDGGAATAERLLNPVGVALDGQGTLYVADRGGDRISRVDPSGTITRVAGTGVSGDGPDGVATLAQLRSPAGIAVDGVGNLYVADTGNNRIRRIDPNGVMTTIAGIGGFGFGGYGGDGGLATAAQLNAPAGLALDAAGALYIADSGNNRIRRIDSAGIITTVAGTGTACLTSTQACGDGGLATAALLDGPANIAVDGAGRVVIADSGTLRVRRIDASGILTTIAGTGVTCQTLPCGDGGPATSAKLIPASVAIDGVGNILIADHNSIRRIDNAGIITTLTGTVSFGFSGDGATASGAKLRDPSGLTVDGAGSVYFADTGNQVIRRIDTMGRIVTVAGSVDPEGTGPLAQAHLADPRAFVVTPSFALFAGGTSGTVEAARAAPPRLDAVIGRYPQSYLTGALARFRDQIFGTVSGIAYDPAAGLIYLSESSSNKVEVVTIVDPTDAATWTIVPLANTDGTAGFANGAAATARFRDPTGLYLDASAHQLYVADTGNHVVRAIDLASAMVRTVAGTGAQRGYAGDGGPASAALLYAPQALTQSSNGDLFIADTGNERVRRVAASTGLISTVLGDGTAASSGEGQPSASFPVAAPLGLACDATGNLFVTSTTTVRLVPADGAGAVDGSGEVQTIYGAPPRLFPASVTSCLTGLAVTGSTTIQITDACTGLLVELDRGPQ